MNCIKEVLQQKDISIKKMAEDLKMDYSQAHKLVNRSSLDTIQLATLIKIAVYLDVEIEDLYKY